MPFADRRATWSVVGVTALNVVVGCHRVPGGAIEARSDPSAAQGRTYQQLVREGRGAFLKDPRDRATVATSAEKYHAAIAIRADEYVVLWEAARTCVWLGNFGPADTAVAAVTQGLEYANTAVALEPEAEEGLFYHGALAGKLADLDFTYGADAVQIVEASMRKLIANKSTYLYGGPDRVLAVLYMRAPNPPFSVGDYDKAWRHLQRALVIESHWIENQLYQAELEYRLGKQNDSAALTASARTRLQAYFLDPGVSPAMAMGAGYEFARCQEMARELVETYQSARSDAESESGVGR